LSEYPIVLGTTEQFDAARALLARAGFTEQEVARRIGVASVYDFTPRRDGRPGPREVGDAFELLVRLFMDAEPAPRGVAARLLGEEGEGSLRALGLLRDDPRDGDACVASVLLYPTEGCWAASDLPREVAPAGSLGADVVFPAVTAGTGFFVAAIPRTPCDAFLELCGGTGIGALVGARIARHAWATDITARATHFAEFNRRLTGLANVTTLQGDVWEAVRGLDFDRIVAHPPYVASSEVTTIFRDGGEDGEQVTRRILEGLPAHLRPGGTLHLTAAVTDRADGRVEQRVRALLGAAADEFDVFFLAGRSAPPAQHYLEWALDGRLTFPELGERVAVLARHGVERIVYGSLLVRRHDRPGRRPLTARRTSSVGGAAESARLVAVEERLAAPALATTLLDAPLTVSPTAEIAVLHRASAPGTWQATACVLHATEPFVAEARLPAPMAEVLVRLDGRQPARAALDEARREGLVPPELDEAAAVELLTALVGLGLVE
jgi:hypothetical protein